MSVARDWRKWLPPLGRVEKVFLALLVLDILLEVAGASLLVQFAVLLPLVVTGVWVFVRVTRRFFRLALWRLRNRLLAAYLFIAVIPIVLILALALIGANYLTGQLAVYLVNAELDRRLFLVRNAALAITDAPPVRRPEILARMAPFYQERFPGLEILASSAGRELRYPADSRLAHPPEGWTEAGGLVVRNGLLYGWAHLAKEGLRCTMVVPMTRSLLASLAPGLGPVSIIHFADPSAGEPQQRMVMRLHEPLPGQEQAEEGMPPPVNRLDLDLRWGGIVPVAVWETPQRVEKALLAVHSRFSAVIGAIFAQRTQTGLLPLLYGLSVVILVVELISLVIGITITQTITAAVDDLYQGTQRVMQGDFSHRIEVRGDEQIAELSRSFNLMTENIEKLLVVSKEKERMQAELEIAREVQRQLYPRSVPAVEQLELRALCNPARTVSGDYYDYQLLDKSRLVLAIGDVAGKGISAALLMATLQSSLRAQVRERLEGVAGGGPESMSTSKLVSRINQQLHADTTAEKYATFYFAIYDDPSGLLTYTNAGHLPPLLLRDGHITPLDINGMVVGAFPFAEYDESRIQMHSGDLLACYTDGITEPENEFGEMFGVERLKATLLKHAGQDSEKIMHAVIDAVEEFTGSPELQDDMTLIVARRL